MIGHVIGSGAQVIITAACNAALSKPWICNTVGTLSHELLIEPAINVFIARIVAGDVGQLSARELVSKIAGSLIATQAIDHIIDYTSLEKNTTSTIILESAAGLVGAYLGGEMYEFL